MLSPEQLNDLRRRVLEGKEWTEQELVDAIKQKVEDRINNLETPKPKGKAKKSTASLDDLL